MKISQTIDNESCNLQLTLDQEIWYNHEGGIAIDTSDDSLLRIMADAGLVREDNTLIIYFEYEGEEQDHIIGYKKIKTIQHNKNDYTFIFLN